MTDKRQFQRTMIAGGERLEIVASEIAEKDWQLAVRNSVGIYSIWLESFATPELAFGAALKEIKTEGVGEFAEVEGFEYLLED